MEEADVARPQAAEAALARALRERSAEACGELYDRFAPDVYRFAVTRLSGDVTAAEDIVVETMVAVAEDIRRYNPRRASLQAWVYGIARRRVMSELRRRGRRKSVPVAAEVSTDTVADASDGRDVAGSAAARLDAQQKVAELEELLSETEFEVLVLSCIEELSAHEIGEMVGRSGRAVHSILHRARGKARKELVGDG